MTKTKNIYFQDVWNKTKTFEIRKNDRDFNRGDFVTLINLKNPNVRIDFKISYVTSYEQKEGFVVLAISDQVNIRIIEKRRK